MAGGTQGEKKVMPAPCSGGQGRQAAGYLSLECSLARLLLFMSGYSSGPVALPSAIHIMMLLAFRVLTMSSEVYACSETESCGGRDHRVCGVQCVQR